MDNNVDTKLEADSIRVKILYESLVDALAGLPFDVVVDKRYLFIRFDTLNLCEIEVYDEYYKVQSSYMDWKEQSKLSWEEDENLIVFYADMPDECIGECKRLVLYEAKKGSKQVQSINIHNSELMELVSLEKFQVAYNKFLEQADENAVSGKSKGKKLPYGLEYGKIDKKNFTQHFGQGAATKTPYMNWHVVSIYYIPDEGRILIGIEKDRYRHVNKMSRIRAEQIGNKKTDVAIFYETTKSKLDYKELYDEFIKVCGKVMELGVD